MTRRRRIFGGLSFGLGLVLCGWLAAPVLPDGADDVSPVLIDRAGEMMHVGTTEDGYVRRPAALEDLDPLLVQTVLTMEDRRFFQHNGVDVPAILRATKSNASAGRVVSGASTITQQLGRQYRPRPRTYRSKLIEAAEALRLDLRLSKTEQLERYLTRISYGGNVQGVVAASEVWLGKSPKHLRPDEIALLVALPQAPEARRPDRNPVAAKAGRDLILSRMESAGLISVEDAKLARAQPVGTRRHRPPSGHFLAMQALASPSGQSKQTTLDSRIQTQVQDHLRRYVTDQPVPVNASAMVIHAPSRSVRALVGTGAQDHGGGWIDMTDRLRSPGSTLKPFVYGLAMDDGALSLGSSVIDAPARFGTYRPENFTRQYHGEVRVFEALQHSLNLPAVRALDQVGGRRLVATMQAAGSDPVIAVRSGEDAGLAVALGGTGMTLRDLGLLYTALANDGEAGPLRFYTDNREGGDSEGGATYRLMSTDTAGDLLSALRAAPRPKGVAPVGTAASVAYKTGTSYGFRDSWAAGIAGEYVIIVWVGRPDGGPRPGVTGRRAAAPILFDIAQAIEPDERSAQKAPQTFRQAPLALKSVEAKLGPDFIFPAPDMELRESPRAIALDVSGEDVTVYAEGEALPRINGRILWRAPGPGFYRLRAVDRDGRSTNADIRIVADNQAIDAPF